MTAFVTAKHVVAIWKSAMCYGRSLGYNIVLTNDNTNSSIFIGLLLRRPWDRFSRRRGATSRSPPSSCAAQETACGRVRATISRRLPGVFPAAAAHTFTLSELSALFLFFFLSFLFLSLFFNTMLILGRVVTLRKDLF